MSYLRSFRFIGTTTAATTTIREPSQIGQGMCGGGPKTDLTFGNICTNSDHPIPPKFEELKDVMPAPKLKEEDIRGGRLNDPIQFLCSLPCFLYLELTASVMHNTLENNSNS